MAKCSAGSEQAWRVQREGDRTWWIATGLLVCMAAIFVSTHFYPDEPFWLLALRAFSEAAMVGALADWFAVTALFRYPLGLPIPHTAIIPNNKNRIGRSLGSFVQTNFLSEEVLEGEVVNISGALAKWLEVPDNRDRVVRRIRQLVPAVLETVEEKEVRAFLDRQIEEILGNIDFARASGRLLRLLTVNNMHEVFLDEVVRQARSFFRSNEDWFRAQLREASPWFVPEFVDRRIFEAILSKTEDTLSQALTDRNHELRRRVHAAVESFITKLESSDEARSKGESLRRMLLSNEVFRGYLASLRDGVLEGLKSDMRDDSSHIAASIERVLCNFVATMSDSPELQQRLNRAMRGVFRVAAGGQEGHVAGLISRTIDSWDASTIVQKLEQEVGPDLQYIRINGTLVGGLVGFLLFLFQILVVR